MYDYRWFGWLVGWIDEYCMRTRNKLVVRFAVAYMDVGQTFIINITIYIRIGYVLICIYLCTAMNGFNILWIMFSCV